MTIRNYSNIAVEASLQVAVDDTTTFMVVDSVTGFPAVPFTVVVEPDTLTEEICLVTAVNANTLTVTRGHDGTSSSAHLVGAGVKHAATAADFSEANTHVNESVSHVPDPTGHAGHYLTTDGTVTSWAQVVGTSGTTTTVYAGNVAGGDYTSIDSTGKMEFYGAARPWDEYYVYSDALSMDGASPPVRKQFVDDGSSGSGYAVHLNGGSASAFQYTALTNALTNGEFTIDFLVKPDSNNDAVLFYFSPRAYLMLSNGHPVVRFDNDNARTVGGTVTIGAWNRLTVAVDKTNERVTVWVNGSRTSRSINNDAISPNPSFYIGSDGGVSADVLVGSIDEVSIYGAVFSDAMAQEVYNNGTPAAIVPSGLTDANKVLYCACEDGPGSSTVANTKGNDLSLQSVEDITFSWVEGAVGKTGSFGVTALMFEQGQYQHAGFTMSVPHNADLSDFLIAHVHASNAVELADGETFVLQLEYTLAREDEPFGSTQTVTATYTSVGVTPARTHLEMEFTPGITVPGVAAHPPVLAGTIRRGSDTAPGDLVFMAFGIEFRTVSLGYLQD